MYLPEALENTRWADFFVYCLLQKMERVIFFPCLLHEKQVEGGIIF